MNIILEATGRVGFAIVNLLAENKVPVKDATRNFSKMTDWVAEGNANLEGNNPIRLNTSLAEFLKEFI